MRKSITFFLTFIIFNIQAQSLNKFLKKTEQSMKSINRTSKSIQDVVDNLSPKKNTGVQPSKPNNGRNTQSNTHKNTIQKIEEKKELPSNVKIVDDKNELFAYITDEDYPHQSREGYLKFLTQDDISEKSKRNVITSEKDETGYLKKISAFVINNKKYNDSLFTCNEETLSIRVLTRESNKLPEEVFVKFDYFNTSGRKVALEKKLHIYFSNGIPFKFWFPADKAGALYAFDNGPIGQLIFSEEQRSKIFSATSEMDKQNKAYRENYVYPKLNDSLTNLVFKKYPNFECSKCLTRTVESESMNNKTTYSNGYGDQYSTNEYFNRNYIKIENSCNKRIKVIGIKVEFDNHQKNYKIVTRIFKAKEKIEFTKDSNDLAGGMIASILTGGGEVQDIDLSQINKKFNSQAAEYFGGLQYLRIVEDR